MRIGAVLVREKLPTHCELKMVSRLTFLNRRSVGRKRLGESLVDLGYIMEAETKGLGCSKALPAIDRRRCAR